MAEARDPDARKEVLYRSYYIPLLIHCLACVKNSGTKIIPNPVLCEKKVWTKQSILGNSVTLILCGWKEEQFSRIARHPLVAWQHCCFQPLSVPWLTEDSGVHWIKSSSACCGVEVALFATQVLWWSSTVTIHPDCMIGYHGDHSPRLCDWVSQWSFTQTVWLGITVTIHPDCVIGYHSDHSPRLWLGITVIIRPDCMIEYTTVIHPDCMIGYHCDISPRLCDWASQWSFTQIVWLSITMSIHPDWLSMTMIIYPDCLIEYDRDWAAQLFDWPSQRSHALWLSAC